MDLEEVDDKVAGLKLVLVRTISLSISLLAFVSGYLLYYFGHSEPAWVLAGVGSVALLLRLIYKKHAKKDYIKKQFVGQADMLSFLS